MKTVLGTASIFAFALSVGRLTGLIREMILGSRLGTSAQADSIVVMLTLPDFLVALVLSGGASAVLVPAFRRADHKNRQALYIGAAILAVLTGIALATIIAVTPIFWLNFLSQSASIEPGGNFVSAFRLSLIAIPIAALIAISTAYLTSIGRFSISAVGTILFNLLIAGYLLTMDIPVSLQGFALCLIAAMSIRLIVQMLYMRETFPPRRVMLKPDMTLLGRFCQGVFAYGCVVAVPIFYRSMHSALGEGALAQFNFALRIYELPNAILLAPIVTIFLALLTDAHDENEQTFQQQIGIALRVALVGATGAAAFICMNAAGIVSILFGYGAMTQDMQNAIVDLIQLLMLSLPLAAIFMVCSSALNARNETNIFMRNGVIAFVFSIFVYYLIKGHFWSSSVGFFTFFALGAVLSIASIMKPRQIKILFLNILPFVLKLTAMMALVFAAYWYLGPLSLPGFLLLCAIQVIGLILIAMKELSLLQSLRIQRQS